MARTGPTGYGDDPHMSDMTVGDYANGMPNIRMGEMFKSFGRQLRWVIPLFVLGALLAWFLTKDIKRTYEASGKILVQEGVEHHNDPITGERGQGVMLGPESITATEIAIMKNNEVIEQVIGDITSRPNIGEARFNKKAFDKINAARRSGNTVALDNARVELHKSIESAFWVAPETKSTVINLGFKHEDGTIAVETLNAFIDAYLSFRRTIFVEGVSDVFAKRQGATEEQLNEVERKIQSFLRRNGLSDFDSERGGATQRTENLRAELNTIRSQTSEAEAALASVENQLRNTAPEMNLYTDDRGSQRVAQAELELKQLLAKYLPGSDPVRAKQAEISELKSLQTANGGRPIGGRRVGPNPTYQVLLGERNRLQASADSYREKEFTLQQQLNAVDGKVKKLQRLSPEYNNLLRERDTLDQRLKGYTNKLQEALVNQDQAEANSENVKVISYATLPRKGRNMQMILWALATIGWGFTLFMVALLAVFLDPRLYTDPRLRMRAKPRTRAEDYDSGDYDQGLPSPEPVAPIVPEAVPMRPAAVQVFDPYVPPQPQAYPHQQAAPPIQETQPALDQGPPPAPGYAPVPYVPTGAVAYDMSAIPHHNPYGAPAQPPAAPAPTGPLPSSESG